MFAIFKKELKAYFTSLFAYVYYGAFFLVMGLLFAANCLAKYSTQFGYFVLTTTFYVVAAVIPFCTMRLFAMEKRNRTDQLLFTAPVSSLSILTGKYLATVFFTLLPVLLSVVYPVYIASLGELNIRFLASSYIGVILVVLVLLSIGMFISAITSNIIISAVLTYAVYLVLLLGRVMENVINVEWLYQFIHKSSIYNKYFDMTSGIIRSGDVIYLLLLTALFFTLTWISLESKKNQKKVTLLKGSVVTVMVVLLSILAFQFSTVFDFTAEQLLSLSDKTKEIVKSVENPTDIYYLGLRSRANATYQELLNQYASMNDNVKVHYKNVYEDNRFRETYLNNLSGVEEASLLVVSGDKYVFLDSSDYFSTVWTSNYSYKSFLEIENQITSAISYTNSEQTESVYMMKGHGEETLASDFLNLLLMNNYKVDTISLNDVINSYDIVIPKDSKALIINTPQVDYTDKEIELLKDYVSDGGKLFVAIDPLNEGFTNLYTFLKEYGLDVQSGVVIEGDKTHYTLDTPYYLVAEMEDTEITKTLIKDKLRVLTMTSKGIKKCMPMSGFKVTEVLTTSTQAFSKVESFEKMTTKSENDIMGPFSTAAFSEKNNGGAVFLLTTNLLFQEEVDTDSLGANRKFFLNVINYLTGNDTVLLIDGKEINNQMALYPNTMLTTIKVITIVVIPVVILLVGIVVIILRNKNINLTSLKRDRVKENEAEE